MIEADRASLRIPLYYTNAVGSNVPIWDNVGYTKQIVVKIAVETPGELPSGTYWESEAWASILIPDPDAPPRYNSYWGVETRDAAANPVTISTEWGFETGPDPFVEPILFTNTSYFHAFKIGGAERTAYLNMDWFKGYKKSAEILFALMWWCTSPDETYDTLGLPPANPVFGYEITAYYKGDLSTAVTKTGTMPFLEMVSRKVSRIGAAEKVATITVDGQGDIVID